MADTPMIQLGTGGSYRIVLGDSNSEEAPLGESIEWKAPNGKLLIAMCDLEGGAAEADAIESAFEHYVYEAKPVPAADVMGEEFEEDGDGEDEGDDDEIGDEDEPEPTE